MARDKKIRQKTIILTVFFTVFLALFELIMKGKKVHFAVEKIPAFYAALGFLASFLIILVGLIMKKIGLKRDEDYYD